MAQKQFVELTGESKENMNDALAHALKNVQGDKSDYQVLETYSNGTDEKKHYQIKLKVCVETE
jgi:flavin-binding protein dodecin